jgi:putative membrane protein insertion efficiency factor
MKFLSQVFAFPLIILVRIYQWILSPLFPSVCRYQPTCSHYMIESLQIWGPLKGSYLGIKRIMRCHPWGGHGHDPVPPKSN